MSYIGNQVTSVPFTADVFSGTGSATRFGPMIRIPATAAAVAVYVNGLYRTPGVDYVLDVDYLVFTSPPALGTNNIVAHHLGNGVMATQVPVDGSVTGAKLTDDSIRSNNIVGRQITGNLIGISSVSGNNITPGAITGNLIGTGAISTNNFGSVSITGNLIGTGAISGNNITTGAITGNLIGTGAISTNNITPGAITGNLIGTGAISGNNIAIGAITGNLIGLGAISSNNLAPGVAPTLGSNLSLSVTRISEVININSAIIGSNSASGTNVNLDIVNTTVYYFTSNTSGNVTFNLRGNNTTTFNDSVQVGNTVSVVVTLRHNTAAHRSGVNVMIDGGRIFTTRSNPDLVTGNLIFFSGNTTANHSPISTMESNVIALNVIKKGDNSYFVLFSNTLFGLV